LLVGVDGLSSYANTFARGFRDPIRTGRAGRLRLVPTAGLLLGQVIKYHAGRCLTGVTRRVVRGADPSDGGGADESLLDDAGVAQPADPAAALGAAEAPRTTTQSTPGGHGMTTVPCGATCTRSC
jgi:hypothetical protein